MSNSRDDDDSRLTSALPSRSVVVLYGSQLGGSQSLAERLSLELQRRCFTVRCCAADEFPIAQLPLQHRLIVVCSTTGQGECPDNMRRTYAFLRRKNLPSNSLQQCRFALFGCGDSSYPLYNSIARIVYQRLLELGAQPMHCRGLGDDQADETVETQFAQWSHELMQHMLEDEPLPVTHRLLRDDEPLPPMFDVKIVPASNDAAAAASSDFQSKTGDQDDERCNSNNSNTHDLAFPQQLLGESSVFAQTHLSRVRVNRRLTPATHFQDVRHVEFDLTTCIKPEPDVLLYAPGDVLLIHPRNSRRTVQRACALFHLSPEDELHITTLRPNEDDDEQQQTTPILPHRCTVRHLFTHLLDFDACPSKLLCAQLLPFTQVAQHREKLQEFTSGTANGNWEYKRYVTKEKRSILEMSEDFASVRPPLHRLLQIMPVMRARPFSIASSATHCPTSAQVLAAVVRVQTPFRRERDGLLTSFLASFAIDEENSGNAAQVFVPVRLKSNSFNIGVKWQAARVPRIMIGPGTGIAPFRAMAQYKQHQDARRGDQLQQTNGDSATASSQGDIHIVFGCRNSNADFFYETEWRTMLQSGAIRSLTTAFSRDQEQKQYVQHKLLDQADKWRRLILNDNAAILLAGSGAGMSKDVRSALKTILKGKTSESSTPDNDSASSETVPSTMTEEEAEAYIRQMGIEKRLVSETWT